MNLIAAAPAGNVLTFVFPVGLFVGIALWAFFQRSRR